MVDRNCWSRKLLGFYGQHAVEHVLKGWLSAYTDGRDFRHNLTGTWNGIISIEDWCNPGHDRFYDWVSDLFECIRCDGPNGDAGQKDWVTEYGNIP